MQRISTFIVLMFLILMCKCRNSTPPISHEPYQCDVLSKNERIELQFRNNPLNFDSTASMRVLVNNDITYCGKYQGLVSLNYDTSYKKGASIEVDIRKDGEQYFFSNKDVYQIMGIENKIYAVFTHDNSDNMVFIVTGNGNSKKIII